MTSLSPVRASFRAAIEDIRAYPIDMAWRPAFLNPVDRMDAPPRQNLLPPAHGLPRSAPFAGQALTLAQAARRIADGSLTAVELMQQCLSAIAARQDELNAFVYVAPSADLLAQAEALDRERAASKLRGPLHGIPIAVKDLLAVAGMPNTASSPVLADNIANFDATSIRLLKEAGAIITGKTQTHEFALGVITPQSNNPWDVTRDPGGSSGGSAIAIATGMSLGAMATDTRASVRVPASLCGIVGLKPTFGLIPADGVTMLSWSLDHIAPMGATVEDAATMLTVLDGVTGQDYATFLNREIRGLKIGVPQAALEDADPEVIRAFQNALDALRDSGVEVVELASPSADDFELGMLMGLVVSRCEAAAYHQAFADRRDLYESQVVYEQLDEAGQVSAVDYLQAQRCRENFRHRMWLLLHDVDALIMPTTRVAAPRHEDADDYFLVLSQNCIPWSFIGFPALSLPCGWTSNGLPVGAQIVTGPREDGRMIAIAAALEAAMG